jgi:exopolysaccharide production protein ExoZ
MQQGSERKQFEGIQALRGLAACMVVAYHASLAWSYKFASDGRWQCGASGVDLFFVISGFVMAISYAGKNSPSAGKYLMGRLIRIVPLYWIMTALVLLKMLMVRFHPEIGTLAKNAAPTANSVLHSLLFIPLGSHMQPIISQGWTLNFEMFFYMLLALSLYLGFGMARFLFPVLAFFAILGLFRSDGWPGFTMLFDPLLMEFAGGMAIGIMAKNKIKPALVLSSILGASGLVCMFVLPLSGFRCARLLEWGVPAMLVVNAAVCLESKLSMALPKFVLAVGDASYSLYLSHEFVIQGVPLLHRHQSAIPPEWRVVAVCLVSSVAASLVLYRLVEKPMTKFLMRTLMPAVDTFPSSSEYSPGRTENPMDLSSGKHYAMTIPEFLTASKIATILRIPRKP